MVYIEHPPWILRPASLLPFASLLPKRRVQQYQHLLVDLFRKLPRCWHQFIGHEFLLDWFVQPILPAEVSSEYFRKSRPAELRHPSHRIDRGVQVRYNYIVSAALDGGTSVIVFIMSFAIFGAAGTAHNFPQWWGNNINGNLDRCLYLDD